MQKKAAELERLAEVLVTGEQLRYVGLSRSKSPLSTVCCRLDGWLLCSREDQLLYLDFE